jgi:uncharacterized protein YjbI with pentapeptide repeats
LAKANLRNSDLRDVEFGGADLEEADLRGADLKGASFVGAYLVGVKVDNEAVLNQPSAFTTKEGAPPAEPSILDKTLQGMKGLFGLGEGDENKAVTEQTDKPGKSDEVILEAHFAESTGKKGDTSSEETGFFDKTLASLKGLFGQSESVDHEAVVDVFPSLQEEEVVPPADVKFPNLPVVEENKSVNSEPASVENKDGVIQEEKPSHENERDGVMISEDNADSADEIEINRLRLLDAKSCYGCNLHGVDLIGKDLQGADLEGADLTGSRLEGADLENANLKGAILVGVDLRNADLRGADLYKANLSGADLTGSKLDGALFDEAQLSDTLGY